MESAIAMSSTALVIFYHTPGQAQAARQSKHKRQALGHYRKPMVTPIEPASAYSLASKNHQR